MTADFSLVKAKKADERGNLIYSKAARNFNPDIATASNIVIAEAEEIVKEGELDPDEIHTPSIYVDRVVLAEDKTKRIEEEIIDTGEDWHIPGKTPEVRKKREKIVKRAAKELKDGMYVNLGVGIPSLCANFVDPNATIFLHSENGLLGIGRYPKKHEVDPDLINAAKQTVTIVKGGCFFSSSESFSMIRGSHIDVSILGGMELS